VSESPLLEARQLNSGYGKLQVLWDVNLEVHENSAVTLLGPNGAGKSTLLRALMGMIPLWNGEVYFCGERIDHWNANQRIDASISYMSEVGVIAKLTVQDNLRVGASGLSSRDVKAALTRTYEEFPMLQDRRRTPAGSLSGGQRKMLGLAKALIRQPRLLIMDEPSSGLSPLLVKEMIEMLAAIRQRSAVTMLLAEQNAKVLELSDRIIILNGGKKGFDGPIDEFQAQTDIAAQFFGLSSIPKDGSTDQRATFH
jgi:branched-chain amino acid transport system ATP-binding protein